MRRGKWADFSIRKEAHVGNEYHADICFMRGKRIVHWLR